MRTFVMTRSLSLSRLLLQVVTLPKAISNEKLQKFSTCQTFLGPPASAIANHRPSGDGMAPQISGLVDLIRTEALPLRVICSNALSRSKLCQETRRLFPSAVQSAPINP